MSIRQFFTVLAVGLTIQANADNYLDMEPLKLEVPEMKAELVDLPKQRALLLDQETPDAGLRTDFSFFKQKTKPGIKPYRFIDDMTFVGVPLFLGGLAIKGELPEGPVTLFKMSPGLDRCFTAEARLVKNLSEKRLCRTQVLLRLDDSSVCRDYFLKDPIGNHHVIVPGRFANEIRDFLSYSPL